MVEPFRGAQAIERLAPALGNPGGRQHQRVHQILLPTAVEIDPLEDSLMDRGKRGTRPELGEPNLGVQGLPRGGSRQRQRAPLLSGEQAFPHKARRQGPFPPPGVPGKEVKGPAGIAHRPANPVLGEGREGYAARGVEGRRCIQQPQTSGADQILHSDFARVPQVVGPRKASHQIEMGEDERVTSDEGGGGEVYRAARSGAHAVDSQRRGQRRSSEVPVARCR